MTIGERRQQPLAGLLVQANDPLAKPRDRGNQIITLGGQRGVLGFDLAKLFLGAQIDRAELLALAPQALKVGLDCRDFRQRRLRLDPRDGGDAVGLDLQRFANFVGDIGEAPVGALDTLGGAGGLLAGGAQRFQSGPYRAVAGRERALGFGETVRGFTQRRFARPRPR